MRTLLWFLLGSLSAGCIDALDDEVATAARVIDDCVVPRPAGVMDWSAPVGIETAAGSLWIFDTLVLDDGTTVTNGAALVASTEAACAAGPAVVRDARGRPVPVLVLTPEEVAENAERTDGKALSLVPRAGFVTAGRAGLFYDVVLTGSGTAEVRGTGVCRFASSAPDGGCARDVDGRGAPVLSPGDHLPVRAAISSGATLDVLLCERPAAFVQVCVLARVDAGAPVAPESAQFWNAFDGWDPSRERATTVLEDLGTITLLEEPGLGGVASVIVDPFGGVVTARRAASSTDRFGDPTPLFQAPPASGQLVGGGREHAALRSSDGRTLAVSYRGGPAGGPARASELHLVTVHIDGALR